MPVLVVLLAALLFATTGTAQAIAGVDASPLAVGAARLVIGGGLLAVFALRGSARRSRGRGRVNARGGAGAVGWGALGVLAYQPFFFAGTAANGVAIGTVVALGSAPVITGVLAAAVGAGRPTRRWWGATALALVGIALLAGIGEQASTVRPAGLAASVGAGASYAVYTVAAKDLISRGWDSTEAMGALFGVGAVIAVPVLFLAGTGWLMTPRGLALALWLGIATTFVAYLLFGWGLAHLPVNTVATLTLAEPVGASLLGVLVVGERLDSRAVVGTLLLVVALVLLTSRRGEREPAPA